MNINIRQRLIKTCLENTTVKHGLKMKQKEKGLMFEKFKAAIIFDNKYGTLIQNILYCTS